jgi:2-polyprenyl-6-methoxyphenol hydroxylase-like FAD-dependent oxidoreductase
MPRENFKVIIAGGSVTGLTLANIFERLNVDYAVLEAYPEIAPQKGASIGLWPNGLRILDQLGCYDNFAQGVDFLNDLNLRLKGKSVGFFQGISSHMRARCVFSLTAELYLRA